MKLGDLLPNTATRRSLPGPVPGETFVDQQPDPMPTPLELVEGEPEPSPQPDPTSIDPAALTDEALYLLAEDAIRKTDLGRESDVAAKEARRLLERAMDARQMISITVHGRVLKIECDKRGDITLKYLKTKLPPEQATEIWKKKPTKPYRRVEIPHATSVDPLD